MFFGELGFGRELVLGEDEIKKENGSLVIGEPRCVCASVFVWEIYIDPPNFSLISARSRSLLSSGWRLSMSF